MQCHILVPAYTCVHAGAYMYAVANKSLLLLIYLSPTIKIGTFEAIPVSARICDGISGYARPRIFASAPALLFSYLPLPHV